MEKLSVLEWLGQQLVSRDECSYGTLSMANTIFGSDVVRQVISVIHPGGVGAGAGLNNSSTISSSTSHLKDRPDIILIPFDSKVTAQQGTCSRCSCSCCLVYVLNLLIVISSFPSLLLSSSPSSSSSPLSSYIMVPSSPSFPPSNRTDREV